METNTNSLADPIGLVSKFSQPKADVSITKSKIEYPPEILTPPSVSNKIRLNLTGEQESQPTTNDLQHIHESSLNARDSIMSSIGEAYRSSVPFARSMQLTPTRENLDDILFYNAKHTEDNALYSRADKEVQDIYKKWGKDYYDDLDEAKSFAELIQIDSEMEFAKNDQEKFNANHSFPAQMGLYVAASLADPVTYTGYGLLAKVANISKVASALSKGGTAARASFYGTGSAIIESSSIAQVESSGARDYENVAYTGLFAFMMAGGASLASDTLKTNFAHNKSEAFKKLEKDGLTMKASNPDEYKNLLDHYLAEDNLSPYRSKVAKVFGSILPKRLEHSPTYLAWERGGAIAALASSFDTLPGLSTKTATEMRLGASDKEIADVALKNGKTAMDVKYELMEHVFHLDLARKQAFDSYNESLRKAGSKPLGKEEFSSLIWSKMNSNHSRYQEVKVAEITNIKSDKKTMEEIKNKASKIEGEEDFIKLSDEEKATALKHEEDNLIDMEARDRLKETDTWLQREEDTILGKMINETNKYYKNMADSMIGSGIKYSKTFDPNFYMPRMYNQAAIDANKKGALNAFEDAIKQSAEYKAALNDEMIKLNNLEKEKSSSSEASSKIAILKSRIRELDDIEERVQQIMDDPTLTPLYKARMMNRAVRLSSELQDESIMRVFKENGDTYTKYSSARDAGAEIHQRNGKLITKDEYDIALSGEPKELTTAETYKFLEEEDGKTVASELKKAREDVSKLIEKSGSIKNLMNATGIDISDFFSNLVKNGIKDIGIGYKQGRTVVGVSGDGEQAIIHELLHGLTTEMRTAKNSDMFAIKRELFAKKNKILDKLEEQGVNLDAKSEASGSTFRERVDYMLSDEADELYSVSLSNPEIARALNEIPSGVKIKGKKISILERMFGSLYKFLGVKSPNKGSALETIVNSIKKDAIEIKYNKNTIKNIKNYKQRQEELIKAEGEKESIETSIQSNEERADDAAARGNEEAVNRFNSAVEKSKEKLPEIEAKIKKLKRDSSTSIRFINKAIKTERDSVNNKILEAKSNINSKIESTIDSVDKDIKAAQDEIERLISYPKKSARGTVNSILATNRIDQLSELSNIPSRLKGRSIMIDPSKGEMNKFMHTDEAAINQMYHYSLSGRIATQHATGFTDVDEYMAYIKENGNLEKKDLKVAKDLFELTSGTRQIANNPDEAWQKIARNVTNFNYITMGGQFAKYGVSEIGAGVYATGIGYLKELVPAMKTTIDLYKGRKLTAIQEDIISMSEAGEILSNSTNSKFGDYEHIESTFAGKTETLFKKGSRATFRYSGLEGITSLTKVALPRAFLRRILRQAGDGKGYYDLIRWGISSEDMQKIALQPIKKDKNGLITDFNLDAWDKDIAEKFKLATSRMSRDAIMRPDATRIPAWMNDGNNVPFKILKQFMSFASLANERLFLRGFSENRRMAIVGTMTSMGVLASIEKAIEEFAISVGIEDRDNARYDLDTEKGVKNLARVIAMRNSFVGAPHIIAESVMNMNSFNGGERVLGQIGGPTVGRAMNGFKAIGEQIDGKTGTAAQINFINGLVPFKFPIIANYANDLAAEMREEAKNKNFGRGFPERR